MICDEIGCDMEPSSMTPALGAWGQLQRKLWEMHHHWGGSWTNRLRSDFPIAQRSLHGKEPHSNSGLKGWVEQLPGPFLSSHILKQGKA